MTPHALKKSPHHRALITALLVALVSVFVVPQSRAQEVPADVQRELRQRGMTEEQAREQAARMGIDLDNPAQAAQRARELGIPEATIQRLLRAVSDVETVPEPAVALPAIVDTVVLVDQDAIDDDAEELADQRRAAERDVDTPLEDYGRKKEIKYFGYGLFENVPQAFEPNSVGPVDDGYIVGPADELRLSVWGAAEFQYDITVDREGRVFIPNVGQLTVAGSRLESLRQDMRNSLSRSYAGLTSDPPECLHGPHAHEAAPRPGVCAR